MLSPLPGGQLWWWWWVFKGSVSGDESSLCANMKTDCFYSVLSGAWICLSAPLNMLVLSPGSGDWSGALRVILEQDELSSSALKAETLWWLLYLAGWGLVSALRSVRNGQFSSSAYAGSVAWSSMLLKTKCGFGHLHRQLYGQSILTSIHTVLCWEYTASECV